MTLFILAAGMGSRYGGLKQIDKFTDHGEFIIDFSIYDAVQAGFDRVVFIIKEENYQIFKDTVGKRIEGAVKVEYAFQSLDMCMDGHTPPEGRVKPWGTTHAVLCAKEYLNDTFAVINSDDFYGRDPFFKVASFLKSKDLTSREFCMVGYQVGNTLTDNGSVSRGVCETTDGKLDSIIERTKIVREGDSARFYEGDSFVDFPLDTPVSMNFWGFTPTVFEGLEEDFKDFLAEKGNELKSEALLPNSVGRMIKENKCSVSVLGTDAKWFGVTYAEDKPGTIAKIRELVAAGVYPDGLWK